jgi:hypothetical protein
MPSISPQTISHHLAMKPSEELEAFGSMSLGDLNRMLLSLGDECPNVQQFLRWVKRDPNNNVGYQVFCRICIGIRLDEIRGSTKTLRALYVTPSIDDRVLERPRKSCPVRACSYYLRQLDSLIRSAYADTADQYR